MTIINKVSVVLGAVVFAGAKTATYELRTNCGVNLGCSPDGASLEELKECQQKYAEEGCIADVLAANIGGGEESCARLITQPDIQAWPFTTSGCMEVVLESPPSQAMRCAPMGGRGAPLDTAGHGPRSALVSEYKMPLIYETSAVGLNFYATGMSAECYARAQVGTTTAISCDGDDEVGEEVDTTLYVDEDSYIVSLTGINITRVEGQEAYIKITLSGCDARQAVLKQTYGYEPVDCTKYVPIDESEKDTTKCQTMCRLLYAHYGTVYDDSVYASQCKLVAPESSTEPEDTPAAADETYTGASSAQS